MRFLSVCSGIEAASVAWNPLGWEAVAFSEIEPFPCSVLAHHYQSVPNWGDMTKYKEWPHVSVDVLCGGTPCQSFSVAGLRGGLADERGNLMLTYAAIARKYRPRWLVWENVPGVLSSEGGRDFGSLLGLLSGRAVTVPAGGWKNGGVVPGIQGAYGLAWRVLDAQFAGLAQRRERVFLVGRLGNWHRAAAVLLERHSLSGHPAPSRKTRKDTAAGAGDGTAFCVRPPSKGAAWKGDGADNLIAGTLNASGKAAGSATQQDAESGLLIAHSLRAEGFDASEDGTGRGTPLIAVDWQNSARGPNSDDTFQTLTSDRTPAIAFGWQNSAQQGDSASEHLSPTLDKSKTPAIAVNMQPAPTMQVRRLTPRECERLQGFADDYTLVPHRRKPAKDGPRYRAIGNSWAIPCVRWIGERIDAVNRIPEANP